jgi:hypothetical protein
VNILEKLEEIERKQSELAAAKDALVHEASSESFYFNNAMSLCQRVSAGTRLLLHKEEAIELYRFLHGIFGGEES